MGPRDECALAVRVSRSLIDTRDRPRSLPGWRWRNCALGGDGSGGVPLPAWATPALTGAWTAYFEAARRTSSSCASISLARCWHSRSARTGWRRLGEAQETADLIAYYCDADGSTTTGTGVGLMAARSARRIPVSDNQSVLRPLRAVARGHPAWLDLLLSAVGWSCWRCASRAATSSGVQRGADYAAERALAGRCVPRRGRAARRVHLRHSVPVVLTTRRRSALPGVAGVTSTGSHEIGMHRGRAPAQQGRKTRPCTVEMGGKNAAIAPRHANLA